MSFCYSSLHKSKFLSTLLLIYYYMYGRQPKVILTNVLRTKLGRKYTQAQLKTGANFSDAGKLRSDQPPSSSVASVTIWQILNPTLQSLFLSKRQPKVILTNVLRTKIGRKYIDSHVIIDADLSDADKLLSGQLPSSSVASLQTCQILSSSHESTFLSERYRILCSSEIHNERNILKSASCSIYILIFSSLVVLSSDDEDGSSEPKCTELLQDDITDNKEMDQQSDFCSSAKQLEDNVESPTEQVVQFLAYVLLCHPFNLFLQCLFFLAYMVIFYFFFSAVALNKNIELIVDTLDLRRFGFWRSDGGCSSKAIIFLWLSVDYMERIETQLGKLVISKPSKSSEFVFLELSQLLTEREEDRLTKLITDVSKKNRAPDLPEVLSLKQALPLFKDLSPDESSFLSSIKDQLKQHMPKENTSDACEPSYALANKQNSGCYAISLSSALNEEWKEVRETGAVKNLIVYPPPPAKGGLGVTREDLECLEYGEFLNDVIIDFYLKYLLLEKAPKHLADRVHIFSSFFYKCLTRTEKNSEGDLKVSAAQRRHRRVRTWTRHINIFSKDYIFVPVNEESHWYMAVICFPWLEEAVYEECPHQDSLYHQPPLSPLWSESENTRMGSVLAFSGNCKDEEEMDAKSLFSKGRPCILILDSLKAGSVQKTVQVLREYLEVEWEAKRKTHREFSKSTMIDLCPRVPKQDNSSDCGVYLLQYVESFFQNPIVNFEQPLHLEKWFPRQLIRNKREEIRDLILQLHFQQHSGSSS
uniref:SUMO specific peptidase 7 n=1 Tax=Calidris pygmaea TaxID=425635 RepID=A0A8C3JM26_9CHAR